MFCTLKTIYFLINLTKILCCYLKKTLIYSISIKISMFNYFFFFFIKRPFLIISCFGESTFANLYLFFLNKIELTSNYMKFMPIICIIILFNGFFYFFYSYNRKNKNYTNCFRYYLYSFFFFVFKKNIFNDNSSYFFDFLKRKASNFYFFFFIFNYYYKYMDHIMYIKYYIYIVNKLIMFKWRSPFFYSFFNRQSKKIKIYYKMNTGFPQHKYAFDKQIYTIFFLFKFFKWILISWPKMKLNWKYLKKRKFYTKFKLKKQIKLFKFIFLVKRPKKLTKRWMRNMRAILQNINTVTKTKRILFSEITFYKNFERTLSRKKYILNSLKLNALVLTWKQRVINTITKKIDNKRFEDFEILLMKNKKFLYLVKKQLFLRFYHSINYIFNLLGCRANELFYPHIFEKKQYRYYTNIIFKSNVVVYVNDFNFQTNLYLSNLNSFFNLFFNKHLIQKKLNGIKKNKINFLFNLSFWKKIKKKIWYNFYFPMYFLIKNDKNLFSWNLYFFFFKKLKFLLRILNLNFLVKKVYSLGSIKRNKIKKAKLRLKKCKLKIKKGKLKIKKIKLKIKKKKKLRLKLPWALDSIDAVLFRWLFENKKNAQFY